MPMTKRCTPYIRPSNPQVIRLTERDERILETIHTFGGLMSLRQIDRLFFSGQGRSQSRTRLRMLFQNGYLNMPGPDHVHKIPQSETIYCLDTKGAEIVAGLQGEPFKTFKWRTKPRWSLISHDLKANDFRMMIMEACKFAPNLSLYRWIPESEFWAFSDTVTYQDRKGASRTRKVRPDGFFTIRRQAPHRPRKFEEFTFLLEIDMSTEDNPRFAREKIRPGIAYLKSETYRERFGSRYGRWLVVTTGERRMTNMRSHAERAGAAKFFYFTTFDKLTPQTILTEPVWMRVDHDKTFNIIPSNSITNK